ncbi:MAG: hypothetical protein JWN56_244 [Sphingobacteriales bacterium]|nr:hypothetical protein [Sphingobacteriales bacterium]
MEYSTVLLKTSFDLSFVMKNNGSAHRVFSPAIRYCPSLKRSGATAAIRFKMKDNCSLEGFFRQQSVIKIKWED